LAEIKKFLEIDYPRSRTARYYANFLSLRATGISETKDKTGTPEQSSEEFFRLKKLSQQSEP